MTLQNSVYLPIQFDSEIFALNVRKSQNGDSTVESGSEVSKAVQNAQALNTVGRQVYMAVYIKSAMQRMRLGVDRYPSPRCKCKRKFRLTAASSARSMPSDIDHTENKNPLLLDQKERIVEADHPWRARFARFTIQEAQHGLLEELDDLLPALEWHQRLKETGLMIRGYRLLYRDGVQRKRLPPKRLFAASAETSKPDVALSAAGEAEAAHGAELHELPVNLAIDADVEDATEAESIRTAELPVAFTQVWDRQGDWLCSLRSSPVRRAAGWDGRVG